VSRRTGSEQPGGPLSQDPNAEAESVRALWLAGRIEEARLALVRAVGPSVYRFLKAMVRDEDATQDLTQDTFVRAFQSLGSFRGDSKPTTWVLSIARNLARNRARRARLEGRWRVPIEPPEEVVDPRAVTSAGEPLLAGALADLPEPQREAVMLYYVEDLAIEEVARVTGRPANTIKSDLHRARAALRAAMEEPR
jgi:RNA polymerase sigma-70 factor, ECF subfamily